MTHNRLFIRSGFRFEVMDEPVELTVPDISNSIIVCVPVVETDTIGDVLNFLTTQGEIHNESLDYKQSDSQAPYTASDWRTAITEHFEGKDLRWIFEPTAAPYDEKEERCRTNAVFQVIPMDNQSSACDLYMEALDRIENGERLDGLVPEYFRESACFRLADGSIFSCDAAAQDSGKDVSTGQDTTLGAIGFTRYAVQTNMISGSENCWTVDDGSGAVPETFSSMAEAEAAIDEHIAEYREAAGRGDLVEVPAIEDFTIVEA